MTLPTWVDGAVGALVASAAVRALPAPPADGGLGVKLYTWFYNFTHALLANWDKVGGKHE